MNESTTKLAGTVTTPIVFAKTVPSKTIVASTTQQMQNPPPAAAAAMDSKTLQKELCVKTDERSINIKGIPDALGNITEFKVNVNGLWDGRMIKGSVRALERAYRSIKHKVTRDSIASKGR